MPVNETSQKSIYHYASLPLKERLQELWNDGRLPEFYSVVMDELKSRVISKIRSPRKYIKSKGHIDIPDLTDDEREECFSEGLERFIKRGEKISEPIENPQYYIYQYAKNAAIDLIRERAKERRGKREYKDERGYSSGSRHKRPPLRESSDRNYTITSTSISIPGRSARFFLEDAFTGIEAEESWAVKVVREAVSRLSPTLRRVAEHMLTYGHDCKSPEAIGDLGMPPTTYRSYRARANEKLKRMVPRVMDEMDIEFRRVPTPEVFSEKPPFPSDEENDTDFIYNTEEDDT